MPQIPLELRKEVGAIIMRKDLDLLRQVLDAAPEVMAELIPFEPVEGVARTLSFPEVCVYFKWIEGIDLALGRGLDIDVAAPVGNGSMLNCAIRWVHLDLVRALVDRGANLTIKNAEGNAPIVAAWFSALVGANGKDCGERLEMVHYLFDKGAIWVSDDPRFRNPVPAIAKPTFANDDQARRARDLLEKGVAAGWDLHASNNEMTRHVSCGRAFNAMEAALSGGGIEMMCALIRLGVDYNNLRSGVRLVDAISGPPEAHWFSWVKDWIPSVRAEIMRREISATAKAAASDMPAPRCGGMVI